MKFKPREYQQEAISNVLKGFKTQDRGKLIMPCGTGKSWTYLWLYESMGVKRTIVFVPSLTLIKQIKNDWLEQRSVDFDYLCVCSDKDVDDENTLDEIENVTTIPAEIQNFLTHNLDNNVVIYSTYHSAERIIEALKGVEYTFDLIINDEAHRTAGIDNAFGIVHDNTLLPSNKRLYGTATPRILGTRKRLEGRVYNDMNDVSVYGDTFYSLSYREAIKMGIICDYKIVVVGVNDKDIHRMISDERINIKNAVNVYALQYCLNKYGMNKVISFHSRIKNANVFSNTLLENNINSLHINGGLSGEEKEILLDEFRDVSKCVITNAKCLTEGVNIPSVDGIFYAENKSSIIDIVQSTGRALRKSKGKEFGYIIVPIYNSSSDNIDKAIEDNEFSFLINIVSSMSMQDDTLQDLINNAIRSKDKEDKDKFREIIKNNIQFDNFNIDISNKIFDYVINENGYSIITQWNEKIQILKDGKDLKGIKKCRNSIQSMGRQGKLKPQQIEELNLIDSTILNFKVRKKWKEKIQILKEGKDLEEIRRFILYIKKKNYNNRLTPKKIEEINSIDSTILNKINNAQISWKRYIEILKEGKDLETIKKFKKNIHSLKSINKLKPSQIEELNSIDIAILNPIRKTWNEKIQILKEGQDLEEIKRFRKLIQYMKRLGKLKPQQIEEINSIDIEILNNPRNYLKKAS